MESPHDNTIEMAFAKLKAHLRRAATRTFEALWVALGDICTLFSPDGSRSRLYGPHGTVLA